MATVFDVARYILSRQDQNAGDTISNMKLQKLVYYAQGFALAITGKPLFQEVIEAWEHGPVAPALYREYKQYEAGAIPPPSESTEQLAAPFDDNQLEILGEVCTVYGQYSAWKLRNFTHEESPWLNRYKQPNNTITHADMRDYFSTCLVGDHDPN